MKRKLTSIFFVFYSFTPFFAQTFNGIPLPSRETGETGMLGSPDLTNSLRTNHFYNPDSSLEHQVIDAWSTTENVWKHFGQRLYSYGPDGRLVERHGLKQDLNGLWIDDFRVLYSYYPDLNYLDGEPSYQKEEIWNTSSGQWELKSTTENTAYDQSTGPLEGKIASSASTGFYNGVQLFSNKTDFYWEVSAGGVRTTDRILSVWDNSSGQFLPNSKEVYLYNTNNALTFDTLYQFHWNTPLNNWNPLPDRRVTINKTGNVTVQLIESMYNNDGIWRNYFRSTTVTDGHQQQVLLKKENWDENAGSFYETFRVETDLNPDHSKAIQRSYQYDYTNTPSTGLYLVSRVTYEYDTFVGTHHPYDVVKASIYPNPAASFVDVALNEGAGNLFRCSVYDARGMVATQTQTAGNTARISVENLSPGNYFLLVETEKGTTMMPLFKK